MTDTDIYAAYIAGNCPAPRLLSYLDMPHTPLLLRATEQAMTASLQKNRRSQQGRDNWWEALPLEKKAAHPRYMMDEWRGNSLASKETIREIIKEYVSDFECLPGFDEEMVLGALMFANDLNDIDPAAIIDDLRYATFIATCRDCVRYMADINNRRLATLANPMAPHTRFLILFNTMRRVEVMKSGIVFDMLQAFNADEGDYTRIARQFAAIREGVGDSTKLERTIRQGITETERKFNLGKSRLRIVDPKPPAL